MRRTDTDHQPSDSCSILCIVFASVDMWCPESGDHVSMWRAHSGIYEENPSAREASGSPASIRRVFGEVWHLFQATWYDLSFL